MMENKILVTSFLTFGILMLFLNGGCGMQDNDIGLTLKLNKSEYKIGDDFIVGIKITNNSDRAIRILPYMGLYEFSWFKTTNKKGEKIEEAEKTKFELDFAFPHRDSYVLLPPHGSYDVEFKGKVAKGKIDAYGQRQFSGVFIDFKDSGILLEYFGEYNIQAKFKNSESTKKEAKEKYNFTDLWQGDIISNKVEFTISK